MARKPKIYKVVERKSGRFGGNTREYKQIGTLPELVQAYGYSLEVGQSWEYEKGNKKINRNPKSIKSLLTNLYNAKNNAAADGYSGSYFEEGVLTEEEIAAYWEEKEGETV
jgi:hypothetical protein